MGEDFAAMINECYDLGCLTMSQRKGLITLLFKRVDSNNTKNWRPITLLCADYKIASKLLLTFSFQLNSINVTRGVLQDCPLSRLLYVLVIEALAIIIQKYPDIDGYPLPDGTRQKLCQYADDTMALVTSGRSITKPFSTFTRKKREWLARASVTQPIKDAGRLGAVDGDKKIMSLHYLWIKRYLLGPRHGWHSFLEFFVRRAFPKKNSLLEVLLSKTLATRSLKLLPAFYKSVLITWIKLLPTFDRIWQIPTTPDVSRSLLTQLSAHGILPTADLLIRFAQRVDPVCHCGCPESLVHLFTECSLAIDVFDWFHCLLKRFLPQCKYPTDTEFLFGFYPARRIPLVYSALLGILRHHLWLAQNAFRFEGTEPDLDTVIGKIKSTSHFLIMRQHRNCRSGDFQRELLADSVLGCITSGNNLTLDPPWC
ncbi:Hypothetical predicted protein [Paramuricea clavata]|uniref:Uncharacterized protein n=1 Tax=Paramuricea clavata TaxID=317549 RepID=A0A7D9IIR7_PARCT|nr:Hypothetical predicted protein [Paramuricea clavata]